MQMRICCTKCINIGADRKVLAHRLAGIYLAFFMYKGGYMKEKVLSIFIDESGDFGQEI